MGACLLAEERETLPRFCWWRAVVTPWGPEGHPEALARRVRWSAGCSFSQTADRRK